MSEVTRFAPSPNGYLHPGHAYSARFARDAAHAAGPGGRFLLRIEDIDQGRARPEYEAAIFDDLSWLGFDWPRPVLRQSERMAAYASALETLEEARLTYRCFCTRADIAAATDAPHGPAGPVYPGTCRSLTAQESDDRAAGGGPFAVRLDLARALRMTGPVSWTEAETPRTIAEDTLCAVQGDVVLARKDFPTSYHLSVVIDDALQGITLVTRGADLDFATPLHRLLQMLLGLPEPRWHHHRLIRDGSGERLAKRRKSPTLRALREEGLSPDDIWQLVGA